MPSELNAVELEERRYKSFELKKAGADYATIAKQLGISPATAWRDVRWVLDLIQPDEKEIESFRKLELSRIEGYLLRLYPRIQQNDLQAISMAIKISQRISALKGLDVNKHEIELGEHTLKAISPEQAKKELIKAYEDRLRENEGSDKLPTE